jgi:hypothetical protein
MKILKSAVGMILAAVLASAIACGEPPKVAQGTVVSYQPDTKILVLKESGETGQEQTFSLEGADIGAEPGPGDEVRLAYRDQGGKLTALRVMNMTKQDELKQGAKH